MDVSRPVGVSFKTQEAWEKWLAKNHSNKNEVWIKFYKKASGIPSVTYEQALDEALCYGWIDGLVRGLDDKAYLQRFTPRRKRSVWSKINTNNVERLIKLGKMKPSGLREVEAAKADGRWEIAYGSQATLEVPTEFLQLLAQNKKAAEFYKTLNKSNLYAVAYLLTSAKREETKLRRMQKFIDMFARGEKLY